MDTLTSERAALRMSATEWELLVSLLERERDELPTQIHHTDSSEFRARLRDRLESVDRLLLRLKQ